MSTKLERLGMTGRKLFAVALCLLAFNAFAAWLA
jgi:hypothetical protein